MAVDVADVKKTYAKRFNERLLSPHNYPGEWVVRTLLGSYPELRMDRTYNSGGNVLDLGFGDGRNWMLLKNMGLDIFGVEISDEIVRSGYAQAEKLGVDVELKVGRNSEVPFPDDMFDLTLASNSFYYIDQNVKFDEHLKELVRYSKQGSCFVASLPELSKHFLFKGSEHLGDGVYLIKEDIHGLRNGYTLRGFGSRNEIMDQFSSVLNNISIAYIYSDYFDYEMSMYVIAGNVR